MQYANYAAPGFSLSLVLTATGHLTLPLVP